MNERLRAVHAAARAVPRDRLSRQAADPAGQHGQRAERARPPAEPLLRAQPALPRLHAQQPDPGDARDHRLLPGLPHLRQRPRAAVSERDRDYIEHAVREAKRRNPNRPGAVYDFVRDLLLQARRLHPGRASATSTCGFVGKFQQVTSPVTAKGIEDTALYIYNRLVSLNEVGGEPDRFGDRAGRAPRAGWRERAGRWPHGAVGDLDARHQAQRGRARPASTCCRSCPAPGSRRRPLGAREPARPLDRSTGSRIRAATRSTSSTRRCSARGRSSRWTRTQERDYRERIVAYMQKAMREAKVFTSWLNPSEAHEQAMTRFVEAVLAPDNTRVPRRLPRVPAPRGAATASTTRWRSWRSRSARRACRTSTRAPSSGTSASSIRTTGGRWTTTGAGRCSRDRRRGRASGRASLVGRLVCATARTIA